MAELFSQIEVLPDITGEGLLFTFTAKGVALVLHPVAFTESLTFIEPKPTPAQLIETVEVPCPLPITPPVTVQK